MDSISISLIIVAVINSGLGLLLIYHRKEGHLALVYAINILAILLWIWSMFFYRISSDATIVFWTRILYIAASTIASSFLYFTYHFPKYQRSEHKYLRFLSIFGINAFLIYLIVFTNSIIEGAHTNPPQENIIDFGGLYFVYVIYILTYFLYGFFRLYKKIKHPVDNNEKGRVLYLFVGYSISANLAFVTNLILPWFGYFVLNWFGQLTTITMVSFAVYAILTYKLFDVKVITTEILTFSLLVFLLFRTILSNTYTEQVLNGSIFLASLIFGIFLIRSVIKEVQNREKIEELAKNLEKANERLRELDKQKSEFLSFATHQLRSPLTAVKGYSSLIMEGSFGKVPGKIKEAVDKIFQSTEGMVLMVEDFLNISRIEQGRMKYELAINDINKLVGEIVAEMKPAAEKKKLSLEFEDKGKPINSEIDPGKMRQVIANIIDNAIKYTPKGFVKAKILEKEEKLLIQISDSGMGISKEVLPTLFAKFSRAKNANRINVTGTGLGLYLAKMIVEAHGGRIWAESLGEGTGSTFNIELKKS